MTINATYKGWTIETERNYIRISGMFGTSGTYDTIEEAIEAIDESARRYKY